MYCSIFQSCVCNYEAGSLPMHNGAMLQMIQITGPYSENVVVLFLLCSLVLCRAVDMDWRNSRRQALASTQSAPARHSYGSYSSSSQGSYSGSSVGGAGQTSPAAAAAAGGPVAEGMVNEMAGYWGNPN